MPSPTEKELLKQLKLAVIDRYGSITAGARELGVSRWQLRRAVLGKSPAARQKMQAAGILISSQEVAANGAHVYDPDGVAVCAANAAAMSSDDWLQITPWGDFPNPQGIQRLNKTTGQAMVDKFNSLMRQAKNALFGRPIFRGHPDVDPAHYPDDRRYGKITALEARADGLWCKPAWNSLGEENKKEGFWIYPSGVWKFKRVPGGVIEPTELVSVGMTNVPVIKDVQAWTANAKAASGPLNDWETRRKNGVVGRNNPRAVRALAAMRSRRAGRRSPGSTSSSSGPGTHVHIHVSGKAATSPSKKRGLIGSIIDALEPVDGGTADNASPSPGGSIYLEYQLGLIQQGAANAEYKTPGEAKREAKAAGAEHEAHLDALSAGTLLVTKQKELMEKEGLGEQAAWHRARYLNPKEAAAFDNHHAEQREIREKADKLKKKEELKNAKAFASRVHARMARENIDYVTAWAKQKKEEGIQ